MEPEGGSIATLIYLHCPVSSDIWRRSCGPRQHLCNILHGQHPHWTLEHVWVNIREKWAIFVHRKSSAQREHKQTVMFHECRYKVEDFLVLLTSMQCGGPI